MSNPFPLDDFEEDSMGWDKEEVKNQGDQQINDYSISAVEGVLYSITSCIARRVDHNYEEKGLSDKEAIEELSAEISQAEKEQ